MCWVLKSKMRERKDKDLCLLYTKGFLEAETRRNVWNTLRNISTSLHEGFCDVVKCKESDLILSFNAIHFRLPFSTAFIELSKRMLVGANLMRYIFSRICFDELYFFNLLAQKSHLCIEI